MGGSVLKFEMLKVVRIGRLRQTRAVTKEVPVSGDSTRNIEVGFTVYNSYGSKPPTEGARRHDIGVTLNVGWTF